MFISYPYIYSVYMLSGSAGTLFGGSEASASFVSAGSSSGINPGRTVETIVSSGWSSGDGLVVASGLNSSPGLFEVVQACVPSGSP